MLLVEQGKSFIQGPEIALEGSFFRQNGSFKENTEMARANGHHIPGQVWHITHRCHKKEFLLKFARDLGKDG